MATFVRCLRKEQCCCDYKAISLPIADIAIIIVIDTMPPSPTPLAFSRSLEAFKRELSSQPRHQGDIEAFEWATIEELRNAIGNIQREQAQRRGYRNLNKIRPFVESLQQYARVIEVFVSAKPDFLAFIWVSKFQYKHTQYLTSQSERIR